MSNIVNLSTAKPINGSDGWVVTPFEGTDMGKPVFGIYIEGPCGISCIDCWDTRAERDAGLAYWRACEE